MRQRPMTRRQDRRWDSRDRRAGGDPHRKVRATTKHAVRHACRSAESVRPLEHTIVWMKRLVRELTNHVQPSCARQRSCVMNTVVPSCGRESDRRAKAVDRIVKLVATSADRGRATQQYGYG
jgi:hypothetical protein